MFEKRTLRRRLRNLGLAAVSGLAGYVTLIIVLIALFLGLWLDNQLGQRGPCTFGLILLSVPFSLYVMLRIVLGVVSMIDPPVIDEKKRDPSE